MTDFQQRPGCVGATMALSSGAYFDFENPEGTVPEPHDIAWGLSNTCRYNGHTLYFYSVAQHCVLASYLVPAEDAWAALLHDAPECVTGDMISPLKQLCPDFRRLEKRVEAAFFRRYGVPNPMPASVKRADLRMLLTEKRDLTSAAGHEWPGLEGIEPMAARIDPWAPELAYRRYLDRWTELSHGAA